jgi:hypothetical protein
MKAAGLKTEPAFARYLGLSGDPYLALLGIEQMTDPQVAALSPLLHGTSITNRS